MIVVESFEPLPNTKAELLLKISSCDDAPPNTVSDPVVPIIVLSLEGLPTKSEEDDPRK